MAERDTLLALLDQARWAPSGDNTQPWRFEIVADDHIAVHGFDTSDHVLYDFRGHPSHMAHGALLETLRIAATGFGLAAGWQRRAGSPDHAPVYDVRLAAVPGMAADPLIPFIRARAVQRRPMRTTPLTSAQRAALAAAPGSRYDLRFFESLGERWRMARLLWDNARIRLTCPEAYPVHRDIIEWGARFSKDRIPEQAVGVDPATARLMRWVMASWERVDFFNRYLLGTVPPRIQLDLLPALGCAAHLCLRAVAPPRTLEDYVDAGAAMQRLWLTVSAQGLHLQPEMTPVIFRWYLREGADISRVADINRQVTALGRRFDALVGSAAQVVFLCRVGVSQAPASRSVRKELDELLIERRP